MTDEADAVIDVLKLMSAQLLELVETQAELSRRLHSLEAQVTLIDRDVNGTEALL